MRLFRDIAMASRNSHREGGGLHSSPPYGAGNLMVGSLAGAGEAFLLPPILTSWRQLG
jgi:hypothetical protein